MLFGVCDCAAGPCSEHSQGSVQRHSAWGKHHSLRLRWNAGCCAWLHLPGLGCESWHPCFTHRNAMFVFPSAICENISITTEVFSHLDIELNFLEWLLLWQSCCKDLTHIHFNSFPFLFLYILWNCETFHFNSFGLSRDALNGCNWVQICCHVSFGIHMVLIIYCSAFAAWSCSCCFITHE